MKMSLFCKTTSHIVEVQICLRELAKISMLGGHSACKLAKTLGFLKKASPSSPGHLILFFPLVFFS
jgi:hypothetical protein